jgi:signal transduction histidine kinase
VDSDSQRAAGDAELRRLSLANLADYLEVQRTTATDQWLMAVRRDPEIAAADRLTHQQLLDHLPEIYQECCTFLRTRDAAVLVEDAKSDAKTHGEIRWADGYKIDELIRELEVFRGIFGGIVLRFGEIEPRFRGSIVATAVSLVQQFFGEITVHSVAQFADEQQRVLQTYTSQLESTNLQLSRANVNLEQALSERQRLIAVVAHEVRTFLQGVKLQEHSTHASSSPARAATAAQFRDVEELLGQLLDHTALIANREPLSALVFDVPMLHEELLQVYRPIARDKGLALVGSCAEAPKQIVGDRLRVKQIAANLLSNAIKYTSEGHVSLSFAKRDAERWVMQIADTGPGLEAGDAQQLFGGNGANTEVVPRRGIGLAITKDLVDLLGGSLQVITKTGGGTLFEIVLPINASGN